MRSLSLIQTAENITFAGYRQENIMSHNLAVLSQEEKDKINVDLAAAGVAFKERYNMPVVAEMVAQEQPEALRDWVSSASDAIPPGLTQPVTTSL